MKLKINSCACGCGQNVKKGNRYINGHNKPTLGKPSKLKGKTFIEICGEERAKEISEKIRKSKLDSKNPAKRPEVREAISRSRRGLLMGEDNPKYWLGKKNQGQSERMRYNNPAQRPDVKEGSRKRMLKRWSENGSVKIGINEKKILDTIETLFNISIIRQHQVLGYAVDGYLPELNMVIEIDEKHHYDRDGNLHKKDVKRQHLICETLNCDFIRVPDNTTDDGLREIFKNL